MKKFPATADDAHDIALLEDYDHRFTEMSDEMETELEKCMRQVRSPQNLNKNVRLIMCAQH